MFYILIDLQGSQTLNCHCLLLLLFYIIRLSEPYTPFDTGYLKNNAPKIGTSIGSGEVVYNAPYARRQYYENRGNGQRGKMWFERMKADHKDEILSGALEVAKK